MSNTYILSWDMYGLEACINASEIEHERIINILSDTNSPWNREKRQGKSLNYTLNALTLRAKFNPQRHYEIYAIEVDDSITEKDIVGMFADAPNDAAELIRSRGHKIHSDRMPPEEKNRVVIT